VVSYTGEAPEHVEDPIVRIAIIGSGISGLTAAHHLHPRHDITVYEADDRVGGHANTVPLALDDGDWAVDTGFIVYNHRNYPVFTRLLSELRVETQPSDMSLAIRDERNGLEWGTNTSRLFSQRRNAVNPRFLGMVAEILRWNRLGQRVLAGTVEVDELTPVGDVLRDRGFSTRFFEWYLVPLAAALGDIVKLGTEVVGVAMRLSAPIALPRSTVVTVTAVAGAAGGAVVAAGGGISEDIGGAGVVAVLAGGVAAVSSFFLQPTASAAASAISAMRFMAHLPSS